jgi:hypothetical protein
MHKGRPEWEACGMKVKLFFAMLLLGIAVLAAGGFTVRRSRRALRAAIRPAFPGSRRSSAPAYA